MFKAIESIEPWDEYRGAANRRLMWLGIAILVMVSVILGSGIANAAVVVARPVAVRPVISEPVVSRSSVKTPITESEIGPSRSQIPAWLWWWCECHRKEKYE